MSTVDEIKSSYASTDALNYRFSVFSRLHEILHNVFEISDIQRIEISCYNEAINIANKKNILKKWKNVSFSNLYAAITYKIISHFDIPDVSLTLANQIFDGNLDIDTIASLSSEELIPGRYDSIREALETRKKQQVIQKISAIYVCPKCKQRQTTTEEVQLRSLDEPANIRATCLSCGNKWIAY